MIPPGTKTMSLSLNRDQDLVKEQEQKAASKDQERINRQNQENLRKMELKPAEQRSQ
jgi:hypothetical protein